jgi:hypothetical protein
MTDAADVLQPPSCRLPSRQAKKNDAEISGAALIVQAAYIVIDTYLP